MKNTYIVKVLALSFDTFVNRLLLFGVSNCRIEGFPRLHQVVSDAHSLEKRKYLLAVLDTLYRVDGGNMLSLSLVGIE